jgi:hypothetical protein
MRGLRDVDNVDYRGHSVLLPHEADPKYKPPTSATAAGNKSHRGQLRTAPENESSHWVQQLWPQAAAKIAAGNNDKTW